MLPFFSDPGMRKCREELRWEGLNSLQIERPVAQKSGASYKAALEDNRARWTGLKVQLGDVNHWTHRGS